MKARHGFKLNNLRRTCGVYLGCASLSLLLGGMTGPAWGQVTSPQNCVNPLNPPSATGTPDMTGGARNAMPLSSYAAGCNAKVEIDGSTAIGHGAKVKSYTVVVTPESTIKGAKFGTIQKGSTTLKVFWTVNSDGTRTYRTYTGSVANPQNIKLLDPKNVPVAEPGLPVIITEMVDADVRVPRVTEKRGSSSVAIGAESSVAGDESVAIGKGATVESDVEVTHTYAPDTTKPNERRGVYISDGMVYDLNGEELGEATKLMDEGKLAKLSVPERWEVNVKRAVAIGADSTVTGPNSVAIGAGAMAANRDSTGKDISPVRNAVALGAGAKVTGDNGIAIGQGVTAGKDQIRIGKESQTDVMIGRYDLQDMDSNITTNTADITTNRGNITTNRGNIATNLGYIKTNTAGIATNLRSINTNTAGIARNGSAIAANRQGIDTNQSGVGHGDCVRQSPVHREHTRKCGSVLRLLRGQHRRCRWGQLQCDKKHEHQGRRLLR